MTKSESIKEIAPALVKAQKAMGVAKKDATNPFFKSKYADLGAVMEACKDALNNNGITVLQPVSSDETGIYVETILLHESGEFLSEKMRIAVKEANNPQAQGSSISYARRYSLQSMAFIPAEDDDGNKATEGNIQQPQQTGLRMAENESDGQSEKIATAQYCKTHDELLERKWSEGKQKYYSVHFDEEGNPCFGTGYMQKKVA